MGCVPSHTLKTVASRSLRGALALDSRQFTMELHIALLLPPSLLEVLVVLLGSQIKRSIHRATIQPSRNSSDMLGQLGWERSSPRGGKINRVGVPGLAPS